MLNFLLLLLVPVFVDNTSILLTNPDRRFLSYRLNAKQRNISMFLWLLHFLTKNSVLFNFSLFKSEQHI